MISFSQAFSPKLLMQHVINKSEVDKVRVHISTNITFIIIKQYQGKGATEINGTQKWATSKKI
jgi:hypothetical protein